MKLISLLARTAFFLISITTAFAQGSGAPVIVSVSGSQSVTEGANVTLSVSVNGTTPFSYQWRKDGAAIAGATASLFSLVPARVADAGNYSVVVTNAAGAITSGLIVLGVNPATPPRLLFFSRTLVTLYVGATLNLGSSFGGSGPITYEWRRDGVVVSTISSNSFSKTNAQLADSGGYTVTATNPAGSLTSDPVAVTVLPQAAPVVTSPPRDVTVATADTISLSVAVNNGGSPVTYQWNKSGVAIAGATGSSFSKSGAQIADAGSYTVTIVNAIGMVVSPAAQVTVRPPTPPTVSINSGSSVVSTGATLFVSGSVGGTPPFTYQWFKDGAAITGETRTTFQRSIAQPADAGTYTLTATNAQGATASAPARVTVLHPVAPEIQSHPVSVDVEQGDSLGLSVGASGTPPFSYQWRKDGAVITTATGSSYSAPGRAASSDAGSYTVTVSNPYGSAVSELAVVAVRAVAAPVIRTPLVDVSLRVGAQFSLSLDVTSSRNQGVTTYVWRKDGVVFGTSNNAPGTGALVTAADAGDYSVTVTNPSGSVTSAAKVTVLPALVPEILLHPDSLSVLAGSSSFGLSVLLRTSTRAGTFQWFRDEIAVPGATNSSLFLSGSDSLAAGTYKVVVTNSAGSATSRDAVVTIDTAANRPAITMTSGSKTLVGGNSNNLSIDTADSSPVQWQLDGVNIPNATGKFFVITSVGPANAGTYTAVVTAPTGVVTSRPIVITLQDFGLAPRIATTPAPQIRALGESVSWSVVAEGEQPFTYRWSKDGVVIPGATNSSYSLPNVVAGHAGTYAATVTNRVGAVTSSAVPLTILPETAPMVLVHPSSRMVATGSSFTVSLSLSQPFVGTYQWLKDGAALPGATGGTYSAVGSVATAGRYSVVVTNGAGSVRSYEAVVGIGNRSLIPPVALATAVSPQTVFTGAIVTFRANITGATSYLWRRNGVELNGATDATLVLTNVQSSDSGTYVALGLNADGIAPNLPAFLTVQTPASGPPFIANSPASITVLPGNTGTLTAGVAANPTATYQWRRNGVAVPGATGTTLTLVNVQAAQAGRYALVATNSFGSATSADAVLTLGTPITFASAPRSESVPTGVAFTLSVSVQSPGAVSYQWRKNGAAIAGATNATLAFAVMRPADAGVYTVIAANADGAVESAPATLTVTSSLFAGTYYGSFGTGDSFALHVTPEGVGTFVGTISNVGDAIVGRGFLIAADGGFTFGGGAARTYGAYRVSGDVVTGRLAGATLTGLVTGRDVAFSGGLLPAGSTATLAGYYQAVPVAGLVGEVHVLAGPDGTLQLLAIDPTGTWLARGQLSGGGAFVMTQPPLAYSGSLRATDGELTGSFQMLAAPAVAFDTAPVPGGIERLANVSARGVAGAGGRTLIAGFVIDGTTPKDVLIRAVGPALTGFGVTGVLANPRLRLFKGSVSLLENDDWSLGGFSAQIVSTTARVGGFPFVSGSLDAAMIARLEPGGYSAQVTGATDASGVALVEVYDAADTRGATRLVNLSTRGDVGTGGDILIVGVVVTGGAPKKILIRGIGPGLTAFGVTGVLVDPQLKLFRGSQLLRENDNWSAGTDAALIADAARTVGAFALPVGSKDAALLLFLAPGSYSAQLSGVNSTAGVGLVEAYEAP